MCSSNILPAHFACSEIIATKGARYCRSLKISPFFENKNATAIYKSHNMNDTDYINYRNSDATRRQQRYRYSESGGYVIQSSLTAQGFKSRLHARHIFIGIKVRSCGNGHRLQHRQRIVGNFRCLAKLPCKQSRLHMSTLSLNKRPTGCEARLV